MALLQGEPASGRLTIRVQPLSAAEVEEVEAAVRAAGREGLVRILGVEDRRGSAAAADSSGAEDFDAEDSDAEDSDAT
jgi:hypothetical protein